MVLEWITESYRISKPVGSKLIGINRKGERPNWVVLSRTELQKIQQNPSYLKELINCLSYNATQVS